MTSRPAIPKDLGIKIGTQKEALWTKVKDDTNQLISQGEVSLVIHKEVVKLAEKMIEEEKKKH